MSDIVIKLSSKILFEIIRNKNSHFSEKYRKIIMNNLDMDEYSISDSMSLYQTCVYFGNISILEMLNEKEYFLDKFYEELIWLIEQAMINNSYDVLEFLLNFNKNINIKIKEGFREYSILQFAKTRNNSDIIELLIENGYQ